MFPLGNPPPQPADAPDASTSGAADARHHQGVFAAIRVVAVFTVLSRLVGLVRDVAVARVFGDTAVASAFNFASMPANVARRLFGEGALAASFVPEYIALVEKRPELAPRFASFSIALVLLVTTVLSALGALAIGFFLLVASHQPQRELLLQLTLALLGFIPFICATALLVGMMQVHGRFAASSLPPILQNGMVVATCSLIWLFRLSPTGASFAVCATILLSGVAGFLWCVWSLRPHIHFTTVFLGVGPSVRRVLRRFGPGAVALGTLQLNSMVDSVIATWPILVGPTMLGLAVPLDDASGAVVSYAQRLYQFPIGIFGTAVATAAFPALARAAIGDARLFAETLRRAIRLSLFIALPASVGLMMVAGDATRALLHGGNFSSQGVGRAALVLMGYAPAIWVYAINQVLLRAFYARGDSLIPFDIALASLAINVAGSLALLWVPGLGEVALAIATSIAAVAQMVMLVARLRTMVPEEPLLNADILRGAAMIAGLTAAMLAALVAVRIAMPNVNSNAMSALRLGVGVTVGALVYFSLAAALRRPEIGWLVSRTPDA